MLAFPLLLLSQDECPTQMVCSLFFSIKRRSRNLPRFLKQTNKQSIVLDQGRYWASETQWSGSYWSLGDLRKMVWQVFLGCRLQDCLMINTNQWNHRVCQFSRRLRCVTPGLPTTLSRCCNASSLLKETVWQKYINLLKVPKDMREMKFKPRGTDFERPYF